MAQASPAASAFRAHPGTGGETPAPDLFMAMQELELRLDPQKTAVEITVIHRVKKPSES